MTIRPNTLSEYTEYIGITERRNPKSIRRSKAPKTFKQLRKYPFFKKSYEPLCTLFKTEWMPTSLYFSTASTPNKRRTSFYAHYATGVGFTAPYEKQEDGRHAWNARTREQPRNTFPSMPKSKISTSPFLPTATHALKYPRP